MELEIENIADNVQALRLTGRLDAPGADSVGVRFSVSVSAAGRDTIVDLAGVSFLASMGIRLLIEGARAARMRGSRLVLFGAQDLVQSVLEDAAIDQIVPIVRSRQQALAQLLAP